MNYGNALEGTPKIGPIKKLEGSLPRKYLGMGCAVEDKMKPWVHREKANFLYSSQSDLEASVTVAWRQQSLEFH